jgi:signal transduction histidine kinase
VEAVRLGIRAQLLLSMGALLVLALVPLFFAVSRLTHATMTRSWRQQAHALGRAIAAHVGEARLRRGAGELGALLDAQLAGPVGAIGVYDAGGRLIVRAEAADARGVLPAAVAAAREQADELSTARGPALLVVVPGASGPVGALLHVGPAAVGAGPTVRLVALYTGLLGLGLLVFSYFVLTRLVVGPIERLSRAAGRVAEGARELAVPDAGARELVDLGASLATMTGHLRAEEQKLRHKIAEVLAAEESLRQKVGELEAARAQLERANDELRRAQDTLVRSERLASVGRLAAGLAHEIGNPIAAILSFQELLLDDELTAEQREFVERMKRETERVHRVLRDLLDFARPAARAISVSLAPDDGEAGASVPAAVEQVVALVRPQKSFAGVEILTAFEEGVPPVAMRAERIEQVLLNLMLNAADAVPHPGGEIFVRVTRVRGTVEIAVEDNGGGIPPTVRDRLFEPFFTTKEVGKGTGLGLAVCRGLVEAVGGRIRAEDGAAGARFVLALPVAGYSGDPPG